MATEYSETLGLYCSMQSAGLAESKSVILTQVLLTSISIIAISSMSLFKVRKFLQNEKATFEELYLLVSYGK